jgi:periplasmic protein TonB
MEQIKFPVKMLTGIAVVSTLLISACTSNDTKTTETNTVSDTVTTVPPMNMDTTRTMNMDTMNNGTMPKNNMDNNNRPAKTGMAKPDPTKKGKKGKVMIADMAPKKMKADMKPDASGAYTNVDYIPSFPGGYKGLQKYFDDNLEYPSEAQDQGVEGTVRIGFTVDENGKLMNPMIEGSNEGYGLDEEALRVVSKMPTWMPGKINGKNVKTKFTLPVKFVLN